MRKKHKLKEALSYTPEKELEFIEKAKKDLESAKKIFENYYGRVLAISVEDLVKNTEMVEQLKGKIEQADQAIHKITKANTQIIDMYIDDEDNENINTLTQINDQIDDITYKFMNLDTVVENLIDAVEKIKRPDFEIK